jgi:hypothetical protein
MDYGKKKSNNPANSSKDENLDPLKQRIDDGIEKICAIYCKPSAIDMFYMVLNNGDFLGTLHCEIYLATLLDNFIKHFEIDSTYVDMQILPEMKVDPLSHFLSSDSHYVAYIGLWTSNWSVETLLPSLFQFPPPYIR